VSVTSERKLVTVLFCDLVGSTALGERLDPEAIQSVQHAYFGRMRAVIEQFGGTVEKFVGDAVVAVFGVPTVHEDDAERAVRCALEMHHALLGLTDTLRPRFGVELAFRIGVQTGEAVVSGGTDALATGDVMNTAARLEQRADPGQILVGKETVLLTAGVVEYGDEVQVDAKGKADPVRARPAVRLQAEKRRVRSPLVGRGRELRLLAAALERAITQVEPQTVLVVGEPGIGKTRLTEEFSARARGRATVLRGACLPYGEGSMWRPFEELVRQDAGIGDSDDDARALGKLHETLRPRHAPDELPLVMTQLAPLAGVANAAITSEQELRWALGRYLQAIGSTGPVVVTLDDLHWADEALLEAVLELLRTISAVPLVAVLQGRPELLERLTELHQDPRTLVMRVGGLSRQESAALVNNLAAALGTRWAEDVQVAVVARGDGSPLFLEEVAAMAHEEGLEAGVPRSLRALIAARLDLLPSDAKRVAQVAAVVGDVFWLDAVAELAGIETASPTIQLLESRGFVDEEPASPRRTQRRFAFHHALIREVTYLSMSKIDRSELHRRTAAWLERETGQGPEVVLAIAHHLEQALVLRREVFPAEPAEPELVEATVDALRGAASWAGANAGVRESIELLRRTVSVASESQGLAQIARAQLATMLARFGHSSEAVGLAEEVLGDEPPPATAALAWLALAEEARSRADASAMTEAGTRALELAISAGLPSVELEALDIVGLAETWAGHISAAIGRRQRATEIAIELGDLPRAAWSMAGYSAIGLLGLGKLDDAERQATEAMRLATETGSLRALESAHTVFGFLRRAQDRLEEALAHGRERLSFAEKLGERLWLRNSLSVSLAQHLIDLGQLDEAWHCLDRALELSHDAGRDAVESSVRAQRVAILLARGRLEEAAKEADLIDATDPYPAIAELRTAQGLDAEADEIWQRLLELYAAGEDRLDRAEAIVGYARFLAGCGRCEEARTRLAEANALVHGSGARFHERLIHEAETLLS
jgi:class 3 adenylate cyclase/tetratricopeptide (TPR) repeat protein